MGKEEIDEKLNELRAALMEERSKLRSTVLKISSGYKKPISFRWQRF